MLETIVNHVYNIGNCFRTTKYCGDGCQMQVCCEHADSKFWNRALINGLFVLIQQKKGDSLILMLNNILYFSEIQKSAGKVV